MSIFFAVFAGFSFARLLDFIDRQNENMSIASLVLFVIALSLSFYFLPEC